MPGGGGNFPELTNDSLNDVMYESIAVDRGRPEIRKNQNKHKETVLCEEKLHMR